MVLEQEIQINDPNIEAYKLKVVRRSNQDRSIDNKVDFTIKIAKKAKP
jgi:hypothetical protein